ncbi:hypothetical protein ASPZODRAFT_1935733 [Penicilliopsis zonata CBS 506.65]|uniref:Uncharacterized protein n=1 Tax=Penicilliopsis zonata CBS 506.65 TaxID=1073090 RepID=A0A1L9SJG0_9EURO|nr:hypothetical protein ASPZODRAFT_1935733 [Penicilliopsis zonata CBS 506.65]OJJ47297.1 hypothetical protein ASPZODRAFT_1935733 [Penicilliopsis zonata CBS 506.65]
MRLVMIERPVRVVILVVPHGGWRPEIKAAWGGKGIRKHKDDSRDEPRLSTRQSKPSYNPQQALTETLQGSEVGTGPSLSHAAVGDGGGFVDSVRHCADVMYALGRAWTSCWASRIRNGFIDGYGYTEILSDMRIYYTTNRSTPPEQPCRMNSRLPTT